MQGLSELLATLLLIALAELLFIMCSFTAYHTTYLNSVLQHTSYFGQQDVTDGLNA